MRWFNLHQLTPALLMTYANALFGFFGILAALFGQIDAAFVLLILAALADAFDGVIARGKKQTAAERTRGVVADSVADMVSFGVLPAVIFLSIAPFNAVTASIGALYLLAALHRLVVFTGDALAASTPTRYFTGLPVVMGAALLAISYMALGGHDWFNSFATCLMFTLAALYVSKLPIAKPRGGVAYVSYLVIAGATIAGLILW